MKNYELTYLISPEFSEEEVKDFGEKIASFVQEKGGILGENSLLLNKKLAYPIKKKTGAYLGVTTFQLNPENFGELEKFLKSENKILRYLILTKKPAQIRTEKFEEVKLSPSLRKRGAIAETPFTRSREKKVELKEIEKKLEEILDEPR